MKAHDNQQDKLAKKILESVPLESPSKEFTSNILEQLNLEPGITKISYTPLIPKPILIVGVASVLLTVVFLYFNIEFKSSWFDKIPVNNIGFSNSLNFIPSMESSTVFIYASLLFFIIFLIQITVIKNYHNRSLSV
ncbi:MAG: hypothetical protein R3213_00565 [Flavobacteriaceae bacterium]|nr:hypothetical protein [Flavobacteriaceae bacterium]